MGRCRFEGKNFTVEFLFNGFFARALKSNENGMIWQGNPGFISTSRLGVKVAFVESSLKFKQLDSNSTISASLCILSI